MIYSCFAGAFGLVLSLEETFDTQIACGRCLPLEKSYETAWIPGHHRFPENHYAMNYWCSYFSAVSLIAVAASKTCAFLWTVSCSDFNNAMTRCQRMHSSMCTLTWLLWSYKSVSSDGNIVMQSWSHQFVCPLCCTWTFQVSDLETQVLAMRYPGTNWVFNAEGINKRKLDRNALGNLWILFSLLPHEPLLLFRIGILTAWFLMSQWNCLAMQHLILCSIVRDPRPFLPIPILSQRHQHPMTSPTTAKIFKLVKYRWVVCTQPLLEYILYTRTFFTISCAVKCTSYVRPAISTRQNLAEISSKQPQVTWGGGVALLCFDL